MEKELKFFLCVLLPALSEAEGCLCGEKNSPFLKPSGKSKIMLLIYFERETKGVLGRLLGGLKESNAKANWCGGAQWNGRQVQCFVKTFFLLLAALYSAAGSCTAG